LTKMRLKSACVGTDHASAWGPKKSGNEEAKDASPGCSESDDRLVPVIFDADVQQRTSGEKVASRPAISTPSYAVGLLTEQTQRTTPGCRRSHDVVHHRSAIRRPQRAEPPSSHASDPGPGVEWVHGRPSRFLPEAGGERLGTRCPRPTRAARLRWVRFVQSTSPRTSAKTDAQALATAPAPASHCEKHLEDVQ